MPRPACFACARISRKKILISAIACCFEFLGFTRCVDNLSARCLSIEIGENLNFTNIEPCDFFFSIYWPARGQLEIVKYTYLNINYYTDLSDDVVVTKNVSL